ncbi:hypothetical protein [Scytonema sp. NUACC26]|uniref:hypothetical protein n=1 Tax=Scytonema sp. NUACC26 TaxID=3140176 RepID=UPI0034DC7AF6
MSQNEIAKRIGNDLISRLKNVIDEDTIRALTLEAWQELRTTIPNLNSFSKALTIVRKITLENFPDNDTPKQSYYHTSQGKGRGSRYEHLAIWYLTSSTEKWEIIGDKARENYFNNFPEFPNSQPQPTSELQTEPPQQTIKLEKNMTLQLELDTETQEIIENALKYAKMSLPDFVKQACIVYGRTVVGKAKQVTETDLGNIPTSELLNNKEYRTLPGRVEELATRAIQAMIHHNDMATEKNQKWCITATAINTLTGSKMGLIKDVMEQRKIVIEDHNNKHELNPYDNRGRETKIEQDIDFVNFSESDAPIVISPATTTASTVEPSIEEPVEPVKTTTKPIPTKTTKIIKVSLGSSFIEICEALKANPDCKVRVDDKRKPLTYALVDEYVYIEETGEREPLV